jgi:formamidopyrimidine-DNA glycosylase
MPELPEVETIARELAPLVVGSTISGFWTDWPRAIRYPEPGEFARGIVGREILGVGRRAKWLVLSLSGDLVLAIQVKMTGQIFVLPGGTEHDRHVHVRFELVDGRWMLFRDVRKFGRVGLYRRDEAGAILGAADEGELFGKHGPEPLADEFTLRAFRERLRRRKGRLKALLLDQGFIAGVGNIYADEALWRARLHPLRSATSLRPSDERRLYLALRAVLAEAIERRGSSIDDYTAPEGDGEMQEFLDIYQRTGLPCPRCGRPIRRIVLGQRGTHFCSWCQRLPSADRSPGNLWLLKAAVSDSRRGPSWSELPSGEGAVGARRPRPNARASSRRPRGPRDGTARATRAPTG